MPLYLIFWLLMFLWAVHWLMGRFGTPYSWSPYADGILLFLLFLVLGWSVFGAPIRG